MAGNCRDILMFLLKNSDNCAKQEMAALNFLREKLLAFECMQEELSVLEFLKRRCRTRASKMIYRNEFDQEYNPDVDGEYWDAHGQDSGNNHFPGEVADAEYWLKKALTQKANLE